MVTVIIQSSKDESLLDVSELVTKTNIATKLEDEPGKLTLTLAESAKIEIVNGSAISFKEGNNSIFYGFVFKYTRKGDGTSEIIAYDQLRYLKYKDSLILGGTSLGTMFMKICKIQGLKGVVLDDSKVKIPEKVFDNTTYYEMLKFGVDYNKIYGKQFLVIMDIAGVLTLVNIERMRSTTFIGDESLLSDFTFSKSIDSEVYNSIKLVHEDKETKKLTTSSVADPITGKRWGALRHFEKVDNLIGTLNDLAKQMLKYYNEEQKELKINVIGNWGIRAGMAIPVGIKDLTQDGIGETRYFVVNSCTHKVDTIHKMDLELKLM